MFTAAWKASSQVNWVCVHYTTAVFWTIEQSSSNSTVLWCVQRSRFKSICWYNCILVYSYSDLITTFDIQREENLDTKILSALLKGNLDTVHQLYLGRIITGLNKKEKQENSVLLITFYIIFLLITTVKRRLNLCNQKYMLVPGSCFIFLVFWNVQRGN